MLIGGDRLRRHALGIMSPKWEPIEGKFGNHLVMGGTSPYPEMVSGRLLMLAKRLELARRGSCRPAPWRAA
ncbi:MAG: hypothetical protein MZV64_70835 [Ignavibacteriales bacterium]|nr:hypothetical protein [Ignavibacteriales bacterium]